MAVDSTEFKKEGLGYSLYASGTGLQSDQPDDPGAWAVRVNVRYLKRRSGELTGEVTVTWTDRQPDHMLRTKLNFSVDSSRDKLAATLHKRAPGIPWRDLMEDFCVSAIMREERGYPTLTVGQMPDRPAEPDQIAGIAPYRKATLMFAHGGTGKGWITTLMAICCASGHPFLGRAVRQDNVMLLDWEDDALTADRRIKKLCRGMGIQIPALKYRTMRGSLTRQIEQVAEECGRFEIGCVIVDSANWAIGSAEFENATGAFFEALSYLNATAIVIDHVSKAVLAASEKGEGIPYGDVYKHNAARATWELRKEQAPGSTYSVVSLFNRKANHDRISEPFAVVLDFSDPDKVVATPKQMVRDQDGQWRVAGGAPSLPSQGITPSAAQAPDRDDW